MFAHGLEQPTRTASLTSPCGVIALQRTSRVAVPIRFCSRCGLPCRFRCRKRGALLPHLFTLTAPKPRRGQGGRFVLCGTVPGVAPAGCYPAPYVDGARTFLSRSLSTVAGAAVRPTDLPVMRAQACRVKGEARAPNLDRPGIEARLLRRGLHRLVGKTSQQRLQRRHGRVIGDAVDARRAEVTLEGGDDFHGGAVIFA